MHPGLRLSLTLPSHQGLLTGYRLNKHKTTENRTAYKSQQINVPWWKGIISESISLSRNIGGPAKKFWDQLNLFSMIKVLVEMKTIHLLTRTALVLVFHDRPNCHSNFSFAYFSPLAVGAQFHWISIHFITGVCNLHSAIEGLSIISKLTA